MTPRKIIFVSICTNCNSAWESITPNRLFLDIVQTPKTELCLSWFRCKKACDPEASSCVAPLTSLGQRSHCPCLHLLQTDNLFLLTLLAKRSVKKCKNLFIATDGCISASKKFLVPQQATTCLFGNNNTNNMQLLAWLIDVNSQILRLLLKRK